MRLWRLILLFGVLMSTVVAIAGQSGHAAALPERFVPGDTRILANKSAGLFADGSSGLQWARLNGMRAPAELDAIVIMVAFTDSCFYGQEDRYTGPLPTSTQFDIYYSAHDALYYDHLLRDVADYYAAASYDQFTFDYVVHPEPADLDHNMAFYGDDPDEGEQAVLLAAHAVAALDPAIDFSAYDTVILIHAGAGEETDAGNDSPEQIYSSYLGPEDFRRAAEDSVIAQPFIWTPDFNDDDGIRHVLILPENEYQDPGVSGPGMYGSLGVYCFELGLRLGMLSLFDFTPAGRSDSQGIGQFGLMGFGLWAAGGLVPPQPCAFNRQLMGWLTPYTVDLVGGEEMSLRPVEMPGDSLCARIDLTGDEYFLLEYRLQDPDGNNRFSFAEGDSNHNGVPDFYDASNAENGGVPRRIDTGNPLDYVVEPFDPDEDYRERFLGAEWDFYLSDNAARPEGVKGAGSGILIWHIDDGVVRRAFGGESNTYNGDADHKAVDLEEADGIQDLDTREGSAYWLGADVDTWKAEGNATFGPTTRPDTRTNAGVPTGILVDGISEVVVDSTFYVFYEGTEYEYTGPRYRERMTFEASRVPVDGVEYSIVGVDLDGVDLTGSHLLSVPLRGDAAGLAIVAAADSGRIYAMTRTLEEWVDLDGDPTTIEPLCTGTDAAALPVEWLLPVAAGQFDAGDTDLEIIAAAPGGLYAFRADGSALDGSVEEEDFGLVATFNVVTLPPIMLPLPGSSDLADEVVACIGTVNADLEGAPTMLRFLSADGEPFAPPVSLAGFAAAPPVRLDDRLFVSVLGFDGRGVLKAVSWPTSGDPEVVWSVDLDIMPSAWPPLVNASAVVVAGTDGRGQTVYIDGDEPRLGVVWGADVMIASPLGPGGVFLTDDGFGRVSESGAWQQGWPTRPMHTVASGGAQPLALGDVTDSGGFLFAGLDGRLYMTEADGDIMPGWPLPGPAEHVVTPVVFASPGVGDANATIIAVGITPRIAGVDPDSETLLLHHVSHLRAWSLQLEERFLPGQAGAMYGGDAWRGASVSALFVPDDGQGGGGLGDTHLCYPQPLRTPNLHVRAEVDGPGTARIVVYNIQGEIVRDTGDFSVDIAGPFERQIDMSTVASGLYLCKLVVDGQTSVKTIAVVY